MLAGLMSSGSSSWEEESKLRSQEAEILRNTLSESESEEEAGLAPV